METLRINKYRQAQKMVDLRGRETPRRRKVPFHGTFRGNINILGGNMHGPGQR